MKSIHVFSLNILNVKWRNWLMTSNSLRKPSLKCSSKSCILLRRSGIMTTLAGHFTWLCSLLELCETLCCLSNSCCTRVCFAEASCIFSCLIWPSGRLAWLDCVVDVLWRYAIVSSSAFNSSYAFSSFNWRIFRLVKKIVRIYRRINLTQYSYVSSKNNF